MPDVVFLPHSTRSDRRGISRATARKYARHGTPGQSDGRPVVRRRPPRPRPASTRSGQARVNYKRNQRAAFLSHLVALDVSVELAEICDIERHLRTLHGRVVRRRVTNYGITYTYWLEVPDAPADAAAACPTYCRHDDGTVTVQSIQWLDADGATLNA